MRIAPFFQQPASRRSFRQVVFPAHESSHPVSLAPLNTSFYHMMTSTNAEPTNCPSYLETEKLAVLCDTTVLWKEHDNEFRSQRRRLRMTKELT